MRWWPAGRPIWLVLLLALGACAGRGEQTLLGELGLDRPQAGLRYEVVVGGDLDAALREHLLAVSETVAAADRRPANDVLLRRRARADLPRLQAALRAAGYYDAEVFVRIERPPPAVREGAATVATSPPPDRRVVFEVRPGPLYRFGERRIEVVGPSYGFRPPGPADLGLRCGGAATAEAILAAERRLLEAARRAGHARARLRPRHLVVDHEKRTMDVRLAVEPGAVHVFAAPVFTGSDRIDEDFLRELTGITPGTRFDPRRLEAARRALVATRLFSVVRVSTGEPDAQGRLPVLVELEQRPQRSVGGAVGFTTDEGPRLRLFWEHRNVFGAAERLRAEAQVSRMLHETQVNLRKPHFLSGSQDLTADGAVRFETTETFDSRSIRAGLGIERQFGTGVVGATGLAYRFAELRERGREELDALLSLPTTLRVGRSDSLLDPSRGWRATLEATPVWNTLDTATVFLRTRATGTRYVRVWNEPRFVVALRGSIGTIFGEERDRIPADERFYAGGGGSVRGIPFRKAGPLDSGRDPLGGRSLLEGSLELRLRPFERWEIVTFVDAGGVFTSAVPDLREDTLRLGAGLGIRYPTPIGPVRFDVAVPVDPRRAVDDPLQFYISLGQAF